MGMILNVKMIFHGSKFHSLAMKYRPILLLPDINFLSCKRGKGQ